MGAEKGYLIRFFDEERHARNFVDGEVRLGRVGAYAKMEDGGRGDKYEGVSSIIRPHDSTFTLTLSHTNIPHILTRENGFLEACLTPQINISSYILCMSFIPSTTPTRFHDGMANAIWSLTDKIPCEDGKARIEFYAVLIGTGWPDFRQALSIGAKVAKGQLVGWGPVEYGDYVNSGKSHFDLDCFSKDVKFKDQREVRCQFEFPGVCEDYHSIIVGDLKSSISRMVRVILDLTIEGEDRDGKVKQVRGDLGAIDLSI